ncbi:MAG: Trk family potassium uptake protein [Clostridiales bacterium]|nr:Trk family potassium uptake protein [Clostridiales bacterium]
MNPDKFLREEKKKKPLLALPTRVICVSFALVILVGTCLLCLPISSRTGEFTPVINSLFTATSATCVTGLITYDTFTHWSRFGQMVIILLIQIGGLGLVTFSTFFSIMIGKKLGLREMQLAQESINFGSVANINRLLRNIVGAVLAVEGIGALLMMTEFLPKYGAEGIFISCFLAVSAFCNAGFDVLGFEGQYTSMSNYNGVPVVMYTIMTLIAVGGLGFAVWRDLAAYPRTKKLTLQTRVVLVMTAALILSGAVAYWVYEWNGTMSHLDFGEKITAGFFQSVTTRTAGFNSIDYAAMNPITKGISVLLMFIGAAPGSTGGGVKITSFAVLIMTVASVLRGRDEVIIWNRRVDKSVVYKAITIVFLGFTLIFGASFIMSALMPQSTFLDIIFECTSAFATVGLTVGVTAEADVISKLILILLMYLGRVGPISFALSLSSAGGSRKEIIPEGKIVVG